LSVSSSIETEGANRIMIMSAFCSLLHFVLMARVFSWYKSAEPNTLDAHVQTYALFNSIMNLVESATWIFGMIFAPQKYRWVVFTVGVLMGLRIPRAFLANDFHGKTSAGDALIFSKRFVDTWELTRYFSIFFFLLRVSSCQHETRGLVHFIVGLYVAEHRGGSNRLF
jgi:hypothetical protein